jgi:beta-lactamase regulating signal transducer with metallopeptidase domain/DUF4097 and DUF4098 domain-containing protein YvlB
MTDVILSAAKDLLFSLTNIETPIRAVIAATIVLGAAGLATTLLRRASASVRHSIWLVGLTTSLGIAALSVLGPVFEVETTVVNGPGVVPFPSDFLQSLPGAAPTSTAPATTPIGADFVELRNDIQGANLVLVLWLAGAIAIIGRAVIGHIGIARLLRRARPLARTVADNGVDVRISADINAPFTLGARRAVIVLPAEASSWDDERLRIVLVHERAHVARLDYVAQLVATATCAVYWFNPVTWIAASRLRAEAELAADDRVLAAGVDGVTYASHLLELARPETGARLSTAVAVGMARSNRLERRFTAMLDSTRSRGIVPLRLQAVAGSAAMLLAVPLTALRVVAAPAKPVAPPVTYTASAPAPIVTARPATEKPTSIPTARTAERPTAQLLASDTVIERTIAAAAGERISIDLRPMGGSITIHAWDQPQVRLRAVLSGDQARDTRVIFERVSGGLALRASMDYSPRNSRNSNAFELWVPRKFDVAVSSSGGGISIDGVEGRFSGNTGGGEITLDQLRGEANLTTGGGEVSVTNSNLTGSVTTGGGQALVTNTTGGVRVSSGSGPVIRSEGQSRVYGVGGLATTVSGQNSGRPLIVVDGNIVSDGAVSFNKAGGSIELASVPNGGTFTTGGGEIVVGSVGGTASFTTGGGDIRIDRVSDDISATTGAGEVHITVIDGNGRARNVTVSSGTGRITIDLPATLDARFDIETSYTERHGRTSIDSDFPVTVTETSDWDSRNGTPRRSVRATGSVGSGRGLIKIRTVNGDVVIRRR